MTDRAPPGRRLGALLRLARAALLWERVWPACWPALGVILVFLILALFDVLPLLPGAAHAAVLAGLAVALIGAVAWAVRGLVVPDETAARRRIERASGLQHRPLQALADRPTAGLDPAGAQLWAAHRQRMAAAVRRLRVGWPVAGLAARDPWGVRSVLVILLVLAGIDAGSDWPCRLTHALLPSFSGQQFAPATTFNIWVTPPEYTGLPPQFLRAGEKARVRVPTGSILLAQVHGAGAAPRLTIDRGSRALQAIDKENFRAEVTLTRGKELTLSQDGVTLGRWPIEIVPDRPPAIAFARPPSATPRAALRLDYRAGDDYGVEAVAAVIRRVGGDPHEVIHLQLPLPGLHLKEAHNTSYHDLAAHPWAGLPVEIRLVATDALGQNGESAPARMILPERVFHNPVARAIVDQRRELVRNPNSREAVAEILGDLNKRPALYRDDIVVFLALRIAQQRLRMEQGPAATAAVERLMWDTALRIEDGGMSLAERQLRRLQRQLQDALARNAPDAEVDRLMGELQQALDRYLQALAQNLRRHPQETARSNEQSRIVTGRDLQRLLERARELAENGQRDRARQLLSQLQNMLENLRLARPDTQRQRSEQAARQMMHGMEQLMQRQQQLLDKSFRAQQQRAEQGGADQRGQPSAGDQGAQGDMSGAAGEQDSLRHALGEIMRKLGTETGEIPGPLGRAERAMNDAVGALQRDQPGAAIGPQSEALDQLQEGSRELAQQLQRSLSRGPGQPGNGAVGAMGMPGEEEGGRDPLGRPTTGLGTYDEGDVKIPNASPMQQSRKILDELRRRAGERYRPKIELDYIDRLLRQF